MNKTTFLEYNFKCPMCGAKLLLRDSKKGQFIGCSQFGPSKCEFNAPMEEYFDMTPPEKRV